MTGSARLPRREWSSAKRSAAAVPRAAGLVGGSAALVALLCGPSCVQPWTFCGHRTTQVGHADTLGLRTNRGHSGGSAALRRNAAARPARPGRRPEASEWRLRVGHALDTLRSDMTELFNTSRDLDYSIFSQDVVLEDALLPNFRLHGLEAYQTALDMMRWSARAACNGQRIEVTAISPPVNGVIYMRWRVHLWPKDPLGPAKDFLTPSLGWNSPLLYSVGAHEPTILEGYSRYTFDPWSAEIIRHTIDITNPPMPIVDLLRRHLPVPAFQLGIQLPQAVPFAAGQVQLPLGDASTRQAAALGEEAQEHAVLMQLSVTGDGFVPSQRFQSPLAGDLAAFLAFSDEMGRPRTPSLSLKWQLHAGSRQPPSCTRPSGDDGDR
eukprot:CAMPEP_0168369064 /NCGR_PEP_ID=MMETSP0228-20121227/6569_1 /TAXON_ID=133427 /ORGANISM="Protoceratium reticulatum, Strain CCCM 535 (=CCMP 1889)" /LENGTH=379 /DNA_ID=CAMNT_0008381921 /DNA_START=21 /DNA_END=1158 /DNA_ORIENTATION=+